MLKDLCYLFHLICSSSAIRMNTIPSHLIIYNSFFLSFFLPSTPAVFLSIILSIFSLTLPFLFCSLNKNVSCFSLNQTKSLNDVVFSCKANIGEEKIDTNNQNEIENDNKNENEIKHISTGGLRAVVMRGGPLDLGFHHTDSNRLKMTIEMYVSFSEKGIKSSGGLKDDNLFLMIRTLGGSESSSSSPIKKSLEGSSSLLESLTSTGIMWSLSADKNGCLIFNMGNNLKSTSNPATSTTTSANSMKNMIKSGPKCVSFEDVITIDDEDEDRVTPTWSHVVAVIDSSSNYENDNTDKWPTTSSVTLYINCEKVAQGDVTVPVMKEEDLSVPGVLYVCPCLPGGSRMTELRMVRTCMLTYVCYKMLLWFIDTSYLPILMYFILRFYSNLQLFLNVIDVHVV